jgi:hypothetical protein
VLAGDSHVFAFASNRPGRTSAELVPMVNDRVDLFSVEGPFPRDLAYWGDVLRLAEGRTLAVCFQGNQHAWFLFAPTPRFDFVLASRPDLPLEADAELLPEAMVREFFRPSLAILDGMLGQTAQGGDRTFVLGTPPPKNNDDLLRTYIADEPGLVSVAAAKGCSIADTPLTAPLTRLKLWSVLQELMAELAHTHGACFIAIPPETQDDLGYLRPEFWEPDVTHANTCYGRLMLGQLLDRVTT